jgi:hypothetical protein
MEEIKSIGCYNCCYRKGKRCNLWEVPVKDPSDSHCESWRDARLYTNTGYPQKTLDIPEE